MKLLLRNITWPLVLSLILSFFAFVLLIFGVASPFWIHDKIGSTKSNLGLWDSCMKHGKNDSKCVKFTSSEDALPAAKTFLLLSLILLIAAIGCNLIRFLSLRSNVYLCVTTSIILGIAGIFTMIGIALYAHVIRNVTGRYHFSLAFSVLSLLLSLTAGALSLLEIRCSGEDEVLSVSGSRKHSEGNVNEIPSSSYSSEQHSKVTSEQGKEESYPLSTIRDEGSNDVNESSTDNDVTSDIPTKNVTQTTHQ